jgi:hypothetical protein
MQGDFPFLEPALSCVESDLGKSLDSVRDVVKDVDGGIDYTICTHSEDSGEFYSTSQQVSYSVLWSGGKRDVRHGVDVVVLWNVLS